MRGRDFSWPVTSLDQSDYNIFCLWYQENHTMLHTHRLVIWGAGIRGTIFSLLLKERGIDQLIFVDSNPQKHGGRIGEAPIISPEEFEQLRDHESVAVLISPENSGEIQTKLEAMGCRKNIDYFLLESGEYQAYVREFLRPYGQDTLIMGDCQFSTVSLIDTDHSTLQDKLFQRFGRDHTKILAMHGMGLRSEYHIFYGQIREGMKPKRLIIMVNFDTLTGKQHLLPRAQHTELLRQLLSVQSHPSEEFAEYVRLTEERSKNLQMEFFAGPEYAMEISEVKARNYFRLNYLYDLDVKTEGIMYLMRILDEASMENVEALPFIPPVNYQLGRKLLGNVFDQKYQQNVLKLKRLTHDRGIPLLDLSYCLESNLFATKMTANETTNGRGRERVADMLYAAIQEMN